MSKPRDEYAARENLAGEPTCWWCGQGTPRIDNRWCSPACSASGELMLAQTPRPEQIRQACLQIQRHWSHEEEAARRLNRRGEDLTALLRVEMPRIARFEIWGVESGHVASCEHR
jgi:hypothetical protein